MKFLSVIGQEEPAPPWDLLTAFVSIIGAFAAVVMGTTIGTILIPDPQIQAVIGFNLGLVLIVAVIMFIFARQPKNLNALKIADAPVPLIIVLLLGFGMGVTVDIISLIATGVTLPPPELFGFFLVSVEGAIALESITIAMWGFAFVLLVIVQPLAEGLIFRGVVYRSLRASMGSWIGFLFTAIAAGIFHMVAYSPGGTSAFVIVWYTLIQPTLHALFLNWVRAYTNSTRASIVTHVGIGIFVFGRILLLAT